MFHLKFYSFLLLQPQKSFSCDNNTACEIWVETLHNRSAHTNKHAKEEATWEVSSFIFECLCQGYLYCCGDTFWSPKRTVALWEQTVQAAQGVKRTSDVYRKIVSGLIWDDWSAKSVHKCMWSVHLNPSSLCWPDFCLKVWRCRWCMNYSFCGEKVLRSFT